MWIDSMNVSSDDKKLDTPNLINFDGKIKHHCGLDSWQVSPLTRLFCRSHVLACDFARAFLSYGRNSCCELAAAEKTGWIVHEDEAA